MVDGCNWVRDYLKNNPKVSESDSLSLSETLRVGAACPQDLRGACALHSALLSADRTLCEDIEIQK
jgi:hypothetical protein